MGSKYLKVLVASVVLLTLVLLVSMGIMMTFYFVDYEGSSIKKGIQNRDQETTKYYHFNPLTGQSSFGFVSGYKFGESEAGFDSYRNEDGNHILVSRFGDDEYRCTGSCYCDESSRRVEAAAARGLIYFVASVSSIFAVNFAKTHFQEECVEKLEDSCPLHFVRAEVDDCDTLIEKDEANRDESESHQFMCKGTCVPNIHDNRLIRSLKGDEVLGRKFDEELHSLDHVPKYQEQVALDYNCNKLTLSRLFHYNEKQISEELGEGTPIVKRAEFAFTNSELAHFCVQSSMKKIVFHKEDYCGKYQDCVIFRNWVEEGETGVRPCGEWCLEWFGSSSSREMEYAMCQSREGEKEGGWGENPTVNCREVTSTKC